MVESNDLRSTYILGTGEDGSDNLDLQNDIFKHESYAQLEKAGLKKKMVVWDVGCGNGVMTEYLASKVGEEGIVYAMDTSHEQIKIAKKRIERAGYKNVQFIVGDINNVDISKYKKADIVYSRFLLMHVLNPKKVIEAMLFFLRPEGVLCIQESSMNSVDESNCDTSIKEYYRLIIEYGERNSVDYNIGRKLEALCNQINPSSKVIYYTKRYETTNKIKKLLSQRLSELKDKILISKIITPEEYNRLERDVNASLKSKKCDNDVIMAEQSYVLVYK